MRDLFGDRFRWFDFTEGEGQHKRLFATGGVACVRRLWTMTPRQHWARMPSPHWTTTRREAVRRRHAPDIIRFWNVTGPLLPSQDGTSTWTPAYNRSATLGALAAFDRGIALAKRLARQPALARLAKSVRR